ncbi:MAG: beta-galactosidase trimerization domain-containing protein [Anaerosomatales bacterium]|nr:beta-galactosidase trimerization domain-containing protein [Anaerosomatales bacterium]
MARDHDEAAAEEREGRQAPRRNPDFPVGCDIYPLDEERRGYADWYERDISADFATLAEAHVSLVRVFISWKCFEPQVGQYDDVADERLDALLEAAHAHDMRLIVCFFADDRLAEMNDVTWGKRRDAHTDDYLIQRQTQLVQRVVNRLRTDPAVWAWDLGNEAFLAGFASEADLESWVATMRDAIQEVDADRPILLGCDAETLFRTSGVDPRPAIDIGEYAISHVTAPYRVYAAEGPVTSGPATYLDSFLLRASLRELPVLVDGVGVHALDYSFAEEAAAVRTALFSALMNGASGVMLRRFRDLATEKREPYFRDPFEVLVGVADADGAPKPVMAEVKRFARVAARIDFRRYQAAPSRAAVVIPAERYEPLPSLAGLYDPRACLQAYIAAKEAHVPVAVAREGDDLEALHAVFVPSAAKLSAEMWRELAAFVQGGGSVVLSYGGGDADPAVREIFGVEFLGDHGSRRTFSCRVAQPGMLGELMSFDARLELPHFALLGHGGATVVATDATGSPLLTSNQFGQGTAVFCATPVERAIAQGDPWAAPEEVRSLLRTVYGSVARAAGAAPVLGCDSPDVEVAVFLGEEDDIVLALNHAPVAITATLSSERMVAGVADARGGKPAEVGGKSFGVPLGPNAAAALRLTYA